MNYASISAVSRAFEVIQQLVRNPEGLGVTELSRTLNIDKSVVHRILTTLEQEGYVHRDREGERFRLSFKLVSLVYEFVGSMDFPQFALPILQELARDVGLLAQLTVVEGETLRFVAKADGPVRIRLAGLVGSTLPLHVSAAARAWLSTLPEAEALRLVARTGMPRLTANTITDLDRFREQLVLTRERGFAINLGEHVEGVHAVAAPIQLKSGEPAVGAVAVSGVAALLSEATLLEIGPRVAQAARELAAVWPSRLTANVRAELAVLDV